jgi:cyclophilin family peptidyl-prolyl cis-trans isomerase
VTQQWDQPEQVIDPDGSYRARIVTSHGEVSADLFADQAPITVNSFAFLAQEGFYDDTPVHRVVPGFVVQMGDPTGTGTGGPGYRFADELGAARERGYPRGTLAMANAGPDTNGSQFFICLADVGLPPDYTVFGEVTEGMAAVDAIAGVELSGEKPAEPVTLATVAVEPA